MVTIILTAKNAKAEQVIRTYTEEGLSFADRMRMRSGNVKVERKIVSENPLVSVTTYSVRDRDRGAVSSKFAVIQEQMELMYEKQLLDHGVSRENYDIQVKHD